MKSKEKNKFSVKRIIHLVFFTITVFIIVKVSMYGVWFSKPMNITKDEALAKSLEKHVIKLSEEIGDHNVFNNKLEEAEKYIADQFKSYKYKVEYQSYDVFKKTARNIIAEKKGKEFPDKIIVVGAHYDTCFTPGADDNSSGVAGLLELSRIMKNIETRYTIRFVAFANEEPPFFKTKDMGSRVYTKELKSKKEDIKAGIILEMIGFYSEKPNSQKYPPLFGFFYPNKGNFIAVVGNFHSGWLVKSMVSGFKKHSKIPVESTTTFGFVPGVDFSDNWSFWQEDYHAVMITDTSFYRNSNYHTDKDRYDTLNYPCMAEVVKGIFHTLKEIK